MNTKLIKQKMKSVGNIKKITRTMEMVSVAKMKKSLERAMNYRPFIMNAHQVLADVSKDRYMSHPYLRSRQTETANLLIILMAANKGLCGGYNSQIYKHLKHELDSRQAHNITFVTIGKYAEKIAKRFSNNILYSYEKNHINDRDASIIVKEIIKRYQDKANPLSQAIIISPQIVSGVTYKVNTVPLLPYSLYHNISTDVNNDAGAAYTYEPNSEVVVEALIPLLLQNIISHAALETEAGEHAARMMAMKTATDNAGDLLHDLKLTFNNARQAKITQEIAELSASV